MLHLPYPLVERAGKVLETGNTVFETRKRHRPWSAGDPYRGIAVTDKRLLAELTASFYFVLPPLAHDAGVLSLLTIARGLAGDPSEPPEFLDSAALFDVLGGVYLHATYDPSRSRFDVRMNAGSRIPELVGVTLENAPPETVCGRLLELFVEINAERTFFSVNDRFLDGGDLAFDDAAPSTGEDEHPWGAPISGCWWAFVGMPEPDDERSSRLPGGFGLSDLRIVLGSERDMPTGSLAYKGSLDHLAVARPAPRPEILPAWELRAVRRHAKSLRSIADDLDRIHHLRPLTDPATEPKPARLELTT